MVNKKHKPIFDIKDRGFRVRAWYLNEKSSEVQTHALVKITKNDGKLYRRFKWPAYKIFNIAAHFEDIVGGELEKTNEADNFLHGFNLTVESEREELSNMIDDLLKIEKKNNANQALVTKFSKEGDEYQKKLDQIDLWAMEIQNLIKKIRGKI